MPAGAVPGVFRRWPCSPTDPRGRGRLRRAGARAVKIVLKGVHATAQAAVLRRKLSIDADIALCDGTETPAALATALADADAAVAMNWRAPLPEAPRLRLLQLPGAGTDSIDFSLLPSSCRVCNVFEHETGISEFVLLAMLEWSIRLCPMSAAFREGSWRHGLIRLGPPHGELAGRTVGLLGYGHIGRAVARRAKAFDMRVVAVGRTVPADELLDCAWPVAAIDEALPECDFLVVCCPLTEATQGLLDATRLARMKPTAVLINVGRAKVVDEDALFEALAGGVIGGAVLDVWYRYPAPGGPDVRPSARPFHELDNVIMTPHSSAWTDGLIERRRTVIADNMERLAAGRALRNPVAIP